MFKFFLNKILDYSILRSFDKSGFLRHQKDFVESTPPVSLAGKNCLITGATSGIGLATAKDFAERGGNLHLLCRNVEKAKKIQEDLQQNFLTNITVHKVDIAEIKTIQQFCNNFTDPVHVLVNNAGAMPNQKTLNSQEQEVIFAGQVAGHFHLAKRLLEQNLLAQRARIIWVSSGGMYLHKLHLNDLNWETTEYNKLSAYSNAKRAQVILNEMFAAKYSDYIFSCMHPGWVDTPGVEKSIPKFHRWGEGKLRNWEQGADTIVWLATTPFPYASGLFWFDRKARRSHMPFFPSKETQKQREKLWKTCENYFMAES